MKKRKKLRGKNDNLPQPLDTVVITQSAYSDVTPGQEGTVAAIMADGYAVEITQPFSDAWGKRAIGTRCLFFAPNEVWRFG